MKMEILQADDIIDNILRLTKKICTDDDAKKEILEFLDYNEYGLAFEALCSVINQLNIKVDSNEFQTIERLGIYMEIDDAFRKATILAVCNAYYLIYRKLEFNFIHIFLSNYLIISSEPKLSCSWSVRSVLV